MGGDIDYLKLWSRRTVGLVGTKIWKNIYSVNLGEKNLIIYVEKIVCKNIIKNSPNFTKNVIGTFWNLEPFFKGDLFTLKFLWQTPLFNFIALHIGSQKSDMQVASSCEVLSPEKFIPIQSFCL